MIYDRSVVMRCDETPELCCACAGVDLICAQGGEGGGHTGEIATSILIPKVVDLCKGAVSPLTGGPVHVVAGAPLYSPLMPAPARAHVRTARRRAGCPRPGPAAKTNNKRGSAPPRALLRTVCDTHARAPVLLLPRLLFAAGGIFDGRGLAMALSLGAQVRLARSRMAVAGAGR